MGLSHQFLHLGGRRHGTLTVDEHDVPPVDLGTLLFDLDERELTGAALNGNGGMTTWPDATGNTAGAVDSEGGAFAVGTDHGHSSVTAHFDDSGDEGGDGGGPRPVVGIDLTNPHTLYYLVTLGADAPDDTEMCARSLDPGGNVWYQDTYAVADDRPGSRILGYTFGEFHGGPQIGDTYIVTCVNDPATPMLHVDGIEADGSDQTLYGSSGAGDLPSPNGIMIANYPDGGYCLPGRHRRWLCYAGAHNAAQRSAVRDLLIAQAAEDGITVTKYDETPIPAGRVISGTVTDGVDPVEGVTVRATTDATATGDDAVTDAAGHYSITTNGLQDGQTVRVIAFPTDHSAMATYAPDANAHGDANTYVLDSNHASVDIELTGTVLDPLTDPDLLDHWDARDEASITLNGSGRVSSWANQLPGRPAFLPVDTPCFSSGATLGGANAISVSNADSGAGLKADASDYTGPVTIIAVAASPNVLGPLLLRNDSIVTPHPVFDPTSDHGWVCHSSEGDLTSQHPGDAGFGAMAVSLSAGPTCYGAVWTAHGHLSADAVTVNDDLDFSSPPIIHLSDFFRGKVQQIIVIARLVDDVDLQRMCQGIGPLFGET